MKAVILEGKVINIGEWEFIDSNGNENPMPEGAIAGEFDIIQGADGRFFLMEDYENLRRSEYPPIGDQLDALYHAGLFPEHMEAMIRAVKEKYPKP